MEDRQVKDIRVLSMHVVDGRGGEEVGHEAKALS